ncbi:MAG: sigma-54 dependent transcriptional regulator [Acidobacteriia bacterium]|nr:sigma-54 dependent transcriptional regulator [Terriglobia bacterium]
MKNSVLIVDDEPAQRQLLGAILGDKYGVETAADGFEATRLLEQRSFDVVITDERMPGMGGIELIKWIRERSPEIPIIVLTAYGSIQTAVEAIKLGAQEYLIKPLDNPDELRLAVQKVLGQRLLKDQSLIHQAETEAQFPADIIAQSQAMSQALTLASQVAPQLATVLLTGESGTGKEVLARFIHRRSPRADSPFVAVNCAALAESLLESELFGHEKGAFTGATQAKRGRFEWAHGGTLFLDEIAEMSGNLQAKLLRVLQEQQFERVGGTRTISVDVRVIAATNRDLAEAIRQRIFREDLYYRLNVFPIHLAPLRDRREDILPLAKYFLKKIAAQMGQPIKSLRSDTQEQFLKYTWPGNVRELQNTVERALIICTSDVIRPGDIPFASVGGDSKTSQPLTMAEIERRAITHALEENNGDRRKAAAQLGISLRTLQYRLRDYGVIEKD